MISKGRAMRTRRLTADRLNAYFLHHSKNEQSIFIGARGVPIPGDPHAALEYILEMARESGSEKAVYQAILSPDLNVDKDAPEDHWQRWWEIQGQKLNGMHKQPYVEFEHQKYGEDGQLRRHRHRIYLRYNPITGQNVSYEWDHKAHREACAQIEDEFGHDPTFRRWTQEQINEMQLEKERAAEQQRADEIKRQQAEQHERRQREIAEYLKAEHEKIRQRAVAASFLENSSEIEKQPEPQPVPKPEPVLDQFREQAPAPAPRKEPDRQPEPEPDPMEQLIKKRKENEQERRLKTLRDIQLNQ